MKPEDRDLAYVWDMRGYAREAQHIVGNLAFEKIEGDSLRKLALERVLELLGEAARRVSPGYQARHPGIEWRMLVGQRNILAHDYGEIDHRRLYDHVRVNVPSLLAELDGILRDYE